MASLFSRRFGRLLISSRSSSFYSLLRSSNAISRPSSQASTASAAANSTSQKPRSLEPGFVRSAPFATFRGRNEPTFSPDNGRSSNSENPASAEKEIREKLTEAMNFQGLQNAGAVLGMVHTCLGAWIAFTPPIHQSVLTLTFGASAICLWLVSMMSHFLHKTNSLNTEMEEDLSLIFGEVRLASQKLLLGLTLLDLVYWGISYKAAQISLPHLSPPAWAILALPIPAMCLFLVLRRKSEMWRSMHQQSPLSRNWTKRQESLMVLLTSVKQLRMVFFTVNYLSAWVLVDIVLYFQIFE